jgi:4'-phosphopantetheinyl transferase
MIVDIWAVDLDAATALLPQHLAELSPDERDRAGRLRAPGALAGFAVTRAVLRRLLARRVGVAPHELRFGLGPHGKPFVAGHPDVAFNVSHTRGRALLALATAGPVGVDVERVDPRVDFEGLAARCFSPAEARALRRVRRDRRLRAFFDGWARKEAFIKAVGTGLSHDLASFTVALAPREPAALLSDHRHDWRLVALDAGPACAAALVVPRRGAPVVVNQRAWVPH